MALLAGNGDGTLRATRAFEIHGRVHHLAVGDVNRDGVPDVAVTYEVDGLWGGQMLLGDGRGGLRAAGHFGVGDISIRTEIAAMDLNGDGPSIWRSRLDRRRSYPALRLPHSRAMVSLIASAASMS